MAKSRTLCIGESCTVRGNYEGNEEMKDVLGGRTCSLG